MKINVLVDWGKAFVDANGSFYCGTTEKQKDNAVKIGKDSDLVLYFCDVHSRKSSEFLVNGGLYRVHNLVRKHWQRTEMLGVEPGKTVSPELTDKLYNLVKDKKSGLIVPRHVFFQDYDGEKYPNPAFAFEDVEETFVGTKLDAKEFLEGGIEYIVNAKHMFNGAGLQSTEWIGKVEGVPDMEMNALTLLKQKYGQGQSLKFDITGVVMGICIYQTATNIKQIFPKAEVNVIADACTHLVYAPLGIEDEEQGNFIAKKMCQHVGVKYLTTKEYLGGK
jgi:hypothetical protein